MNLSPAWGTLLSAAGHEAIHWSAVGKPDATDQELLAYAASQAFVIFTHDLDFGAILAHTGASSPSVIQLREQDVDPDAVGSAVVNAIERCSEALTSGALLTVDLRRAKARVLPIRRLP